MQAQNLTDVCSLGEEQCVILKAKLEISLAKDTGNVQLEYPSSVTLKGRFQSRITIFNRILVKP